MDFEGQTVYHPSFFRGEIFELWKLKMIAFLEYYNIDLLEIIKTVFPSLFDAPGKLGSGDTWSANQWFANQRYKYQLNA